MTSWPRESWSHGKLVSWELISWQLISWELISWELISWKEAAYLNSDFNWTQGHFRLLVAYIFRISEFVDYHLRPLVTQIPSYIKDTKDFLLKNSKLSLLPPDSILLMLDVSSLYTNIPHTEGIEPANSPYRATYQPSITHSLSCEDDRADPDDEQLWVQWRAQSTDARNSHGNEDGSYSWQS